MAPFHLELSVRDYELDQFGVVNNAVYSNYLEHARHAFLLDAGLDAAGVAGTGRSLALSALTLRYRAPLRAHDRFVVTVAVAELRGARVVFHQRIERLPDAKLVLEAEAVAVFLNEQGRPQRIGPTERALFAPFLAEPAVKT